MLAELPTAQRERLLRGDWEIPDDGEVFKREWFPIIERHQLPEHTRAVRYWDLAGTAPSSANRDPDYTVGLRLDLHPKSGTFYITDIVRARKAPGAVEQLVADTARRDGRTVAIQIEQEPGGSGKALAERYKRQILRGYSVQSHRVTGTKELRARPAAAAAENGLISIIRGPNSNDFLDEVTAFPHAAHDDCVDALAGAHTYLSRSNTSPLRSSVARGRLPQHTTRPHERFIGSATITDIAARVGAHDFTNRPY
jgi:predicted phage terminase large subunit-like protein